MTEPQNPATDTPSEKTEQPSEQALDDTKEAMRRALEAKKSAQRHSGDGMIRKKSIGGPHDQEGGARMFRRKAGG